MYLKYAICTYIFTFSNTSVRSHSDCIQKLEHYLSHLSWNDTLMKPLDNRAYPEQITFCGFMPFWNSKMAAEFARLRHYVKLNNSLYSLYIYIYIYIYGRHDIQGGTFKLNS